MQMDPTFTALDIIGRLAAAMACGAVVGFERELHKKPAGLRTHMMVSLGSASFTVIGWMLMDSASGRNGGAVQADPLRIVSGVIAGIGFLGGGSIIQSRGSVEGLTTAAGLWVVGAVGIACGGGSYVLAGVTTAFALLILLMSGPLERRAERIESSRERDPAEPTRDARRSSAVGARAAGSDTD